MRPNNYSSAGQRVMLVVIVVAVITSTTSPAFGFIAAKKGWRPNNVVDHTTSTHSKTTTRRIFTTTSTQKQQRRRSSILSHNVASKITTDQSSISPGGRNNDDNNNNNNNNTNEQQQQHQHQMIIVEKLMSYVNNLQIARNTKDIKPVRSLAHYLSQTNPITTTTTTTLNSNDSDNSHHQNHHHHLLSTTTNDDNTNTNNQLKLIEEGCERAMIQALRIAGDIGDYRLILQLVDASINFATASTVLTTTSTSYNNNRILLSPRIFGEAINAISATSANISKIKYIWNLAVDTNNNKFLLLSKPLSAFELTTMIKALASRGKVGACVDIYQKHTITTITTPSSSSSSSSNPVLIRPDAYTASTLFTILADSINANQNEQYTKFDNNNNNNEDDDDDNASSSSSSSSSSSLLEKSLKKLTYSPCWQWNAAVELLATMSDDGSSSSSPFQWNNHAYTALLKLQDVAQETFPARHRNGPRIAMAILDSMINTGVQPDVVTCTLAIKAMGDPFADQMSWKLAVAFFERMKIDSSLPYPNEYTYSAVIVSCARCREYEMALQLIEEMRTSTTTESEAAVVSSIQKEEGEEYSASNELQENKPDGLTTIPPKPNTWVYNGVFLAIGYIKDIQEKKYQKKRRSKTLSNGSNNNNTPQRYLLTMKLLEQMKEDYFVHGFDTKPDTVTYNTILSILGNVRDEEVQGEEQEQQMDIQILSLLQEMHKDAVPRDMKTYQNAIVSASSSSTVLQVLDLFLEDFASHKTTTGGGGVVGEEKKGRQKRSSLSKNKKLAKETALVFNSALSVLATKNGDNDRACFMEVYSLMLGNNIQFDSETTSTIINYLGNSGQSSSILDLLAVLGWNDPTSSSNEEEKEKVIFASSRLEEATGLSFPQESLPPLETEHFSTAITVCLLANDLERAHAIYSYMRKNGIKPTNSCLENFSIAYARAAIGASDSAKQKQQRNNKQGKSKKQAALDISQTRAQSAYKITMALADPTLRVLSIVAKACATTGQWKETQNVLRAFHAKCLKQNLDVGIHTTWENEALRSLHTSILRQCAKQGNVTVSLWYADDIQRFARQYRSKLEHHADTNGDENDVVHSTKDLREVWSAFKNAKGNADDDDVSFHVGMRAQDWVSLVKAASESGHWRVCVNSLQFLRPYVERTNIKNSVAEGHEESTALLDSHHEQLTPALTAAAYCLEKRSQYAWGVRIVEDWMDWSGRKPRPEAVLAVIRILSSRGRGEEVKNFLTRCIEEGTSTQLYSKNGVGYEEMLFTGAVTALHNSGLYDDADEVMISGISRGSLPFALENRNGRIELDLHGLNVALAHSTVRLAMRQQASNSNNDESSSQPQRDMLLITGRGRNSALRLRPVLRPEVQRMLLEEFYPPLNTVSVPGNMGALLVFADDIHAWQSHQKQQKGARMLALANVLKNFSTERLGKSIAALTQLEGRREDDSSSV